MKAKKFIALLLSFCMAFTLAAPAFAASSEMSGSISYSVSSIDDLPDTVDAPSGTVYEMIITSDSSIWQTVIKSSVEDAILLGQDKSQIISLTIEGPITSIEAEAFEGFTGLQTVTLPASVTSIGENAFAGCTSLKTVTVNVPANVTFDAAAQEAMQKAFGGTVTLKTVAVPAVTLPSNDTKYDADEGFDADDEEDSAVLLIVGGAVAAVGVATVVYFYTHPEIYRNAVQAVQNALGLNRSAAATTAETTPAVAETSPAESAALAA